MKQLSLFRELFDELKEYIYKYKNNSNNMVDVYIMGLNCTYHESAVCIIKNGKLVAFMEEERLNRYKHAKPARLDNSDVLPLKSIKYCLEKAKIGFKDIKHVAYNLDPFERLRSSIEVDYPNKVISGQWGTATGEATFYKKNMNVVRKLNKLFGRDIEKNFHFIGHHISHAAGAYYSSGYNSAAILVIDGIAESKSTWVGVATGTNIKNYFEIDYPNSLGFLWEKMSEYLGFSEYHAAKVMGLSSYGSMRPLDGRKIKNILAYGKYRRMLAKMKKLVKVKRFGMFEIDNKILQFRTGNFSGLEKLFGVKKRKKKEPLNQKHKDIAAALQTVTEDSVLALAKEVKRLSGKNKLCMTGGVALNCVVNAKLIEQNIFQEVYIQPAANDAGGAIGAAFYLWSNILKHPKPQPIPHAYLGPKFSEKEILLSLNKSGLKYQKIANIEKKTAKLLADGHLIAWFQDRMEVGPRALGHRSIIGDPRKANMLQLINKEVKLREEFRPLCPSVLEEEAGKWFDFGKKIPDPAKYMLAAFPAKEENKDKIPAVVHIDGTSRIQTVNKKTSPKYWKLINEFFKLTKVPVILNTSLNIQEPIVCSPQDAVKTFKRSKMKYLVLGNYLCQKK